MKTISDVQKGMRDAAAWLEEASRDLSDLQSAAGPAAVDFQKILMLGRRYPVRNHCLGGRTAELQKQYLTLLAALLLTGKEHMEDGWLFLQRIAAGGDTNLEISALQADAATLKPKHLDSFTAAVRGEGLGDALLLDALLLCLTIQGDRPAWEYISGLAELMGYLEGRLSLLASLAVAVAVRDIDKQQTVLKSFNGIDLTPILPEIVTTQGYLLYKPETGTTCLVGDGVTPIPKQVCRSLKKSSARHLIVQDAYFADNPLELSSEKSGCLTMKRCSVQNIRISKEHCFFCQGFSKIELMDCVFQDLSAADMAIEFTDISQAFFQNVCFKNVSASDLAAWTIKVSVTKPQFRSVTMEEIQSDNYWYYGTNRATVVDYCSYRNCHGRASGLPAGFKEG